jgi:hypothetical protein
MISGCSSAWRPENRTWKSPIPPQSAGSAGFRAKNRAARLCQNRFESKAAASFKDFKFYLGQPQRDHFNTTGRRL